MTRGRPEAYVKLGGVGMRGAAYGQMQDVEGRKQFTQHAHSAKQMIACTLNCVHLVLYKDCCSC